MEEEMTLAEESVSQTQNAKDREEMESEALSMLKGDEEMSEELELAYINLLFD